MAAKKRPTAKLSAQASRKNDAGADGRKTLRRVSRSAHVGPSGQRRIRASKKSGRTTTAIAAPSSVDAAATIGNGGIARTSVRMINPVHRLAAFFGFALAMVALGGIVIRTVHAATFVSPSTTPPGGNIPITIWNRTSSAATQANAAIDIDGGGPGPAVPVGLSVGNSALDLGSGAGGQNVMYGVASYAGMNSADYLVLLQTVSGGTYTNRLTVDRDANMITGSVSLGGPNEDLGAATVGQNLIYGDVPYANINPTGDYLLLLQTNAGAAYTNRFSVTGSGNVKASGCFGATFVGLTSAAWPGNVGSYFAADAKCAGDYAGSHVCRVDEMLDSIQCSIAGDPIRTIASGSAGWMNGGPPGDPAKNANDCVGWTSVQTVPASNTAFGRVWIFNGATGGSGTDTTCATPGGLKFSCCR